MLRSCVQRPFADWPKIHKRLEERGRSTVILFVSAIVHLEHPLIAADDLKALHREYVLTPWVAQGNLDVPVIVRGEGVYMYDADGKRYGDLSSGLVAVNLGHGHRTVLDAMHAQIDRLCFSPTNWFQDGRATLSEALIKISPWGDEGGRAFYSTSGAQGNEDAIKFARMLTGRHKVLTAYRSFHGSSPGAASLTGENRRWFNEPESMPGVVRFWAPFPYRSPFNTTNPAEETQRALDHLRLTIAAENPDTIAALLIEPVVGSNGVIVPPDGYLAGLRALCDEFGIVLIFDEVMTAFGRVGAPFASIRFGVTPDMITFAKGVTSAYAPLGGLLMREKLAKQFDDRPLGAGHTYSGHPLNMAAGIGALRAYHEGGYFERGKTIEGWLRTKLGKLKDKHPLIGDARGIGAFFCLEFVSDQAKRTPLIPWQGKSQGVMPALFGALRKAGVYAFGRYNILHIAPPLIVEESELDEMLAGVDTAVTALEDAYATSLR
jgi:taurine--2-oxoglutarate transaminase